MTSKSESVMIRSECAISWITKWRLQGVHLKHRPGMCISMISNKTILGKETMDYKPRKCTVINSHKHDSTRSYKLFTTKNLLPKQSLETCGRGSHKFFVLTSSLQLPQSMLSRTDWTHFLPKKRQCIAAHAWKPFIRRYPEPTQHSVHKVLDRRKG